MSPRRAVVALLAVGAAALCAQGFFAAGHLYGGYFLPQSGMGHVHAQELAVGTVYATFALAFTAFAALGLWAAGLHLRLAVAARSLQRSRWVLPLALAAVLVMALAVRVGVLERQVISDDEETYRFIAQTLSLGRVINPLPDDEGFYTNQFVVLSQAGWYGKYPVGHPAMLALARAAGAEDVLSPLLAAASVWLTWRVGRRLLGARRARVGVVLLALSPHFVLSHATLLSQVSSTFFLMLALAGLLEPGRAWRVVGALALGAGLLTRPMPGVLLAGGAMVVWAWQTRGPWVARLRGAVLVGLPTLVAGLVQLAINRAQTGAPLESGYHVVHHGTGAFQNGLDLMALSLFGAAWRENLWLFGWPLSLLPVALARPRRGALWLWLPVVAEVAYRLIVPKTVVATTGPTYTLEAVPVLALLAADGLGRAGLLLRKLAAPRGLVPAVVASMAMAALALFLPVQLGALARAGAARLGVWTELREAGVTRALVFANTMADPKALDTWAYYPPSPDPSGKDAVVFVRWPNSADAASRAHGFWAEHFADRAAYRYDPTKKPALVKLADGPLAP